jgi:ParB family chromosome partitioning protein
MYKELVRLGEASEDIYVLEFDEPSCITLGLCYEERPRFSGGAYHPVLKRVEEFLKQPLREVMSLRQQRAKTLLELDDLIVKQAEALKTRGRPAPISKASSSLA